MYFMAGINTSCQPALPNNLDLEQTAKAKPKAQAKYIAKARADLNGKNKESLAQQFLNYKSALVLILNHSCKQLQKNTR